MEDSVVAPLSIYLTHSSGTYNLGQIVAGRVVITTAAEEEVRGVLIKLEGKATVRWTEKKKKKSKEPEDHESSDEEDEGGSKKGKKSVENQVSCLDMMNLYKLAADGDEHGKILPRGETSYAFTFQLPVKNVPCSFSGRYGKIQYFLRATVQRSFWKVDFEAKKGIQIFTEVDLNKQGEEIGTPGEWKAKKRYGALCCLSQPLNLEVKLERQGYCPGEGIEVTVNVNNASSRVINNLTGKLIQEVSFVGEEKEKKVENELTVRKWGESLDPGEDGSWKVEIQIPGNIPPTGLGGCKIIGVRYFVKVEAHVFGVDCNLRQDCPVVIGTVPWREREDGEGMRREETSSTIVAEEEEGKENGLYPDLVSVANGVSKLDQDAERENQP